MKTIDDVYTQEHLVTVDIYQFNAVLMALARQKLPAFINRNSVQMNKPFLGLETDGRFMMVQPLYPDRRFYAPKVDYDLWVEFERIDPEGSKPRVRP